MAEIGSKLIWHIINTSIYSAVKTDPASTRIFKQLIIVKRIRSLTHSTFILFIILVSMSCQIWGWDEFSVQFSMLKDSLPQNKNLLWDEIKVLSYLNEKHILGYNISHDPAQSKQRNIHYYSDVIEAMNIIRFFSNHNEPNYISCTTLRAKAERGFCQHIKLTAFFHCKSHPQRQLHNPTLLWSQL